MVLSQQNLNPKIILNDSSLNKSNFDWYHLIDYVSRKRIFVEIQYKTNNVELLAIGKAFKT